MSKRKLLKAPLAEDNKLSVDPTAIVRAALLLTRDRKGCYYNRLNILWRASIIHALWG